MAKQEFEYGEMYWAQEKIFAITQDWWEVYRDEWNGKTVFPGERVPQRGFGHVWHEYGLQERLGLVVGDEVGYDGTCQQLSDGWLLTDVDGSKVRLEVKEIPPEELPPQPSPQPQPSDPLPPSPPTSPFVWLPTRGGRNLSFAMGWEPVEGYPNLVRIHWTHGYYTTMNPDGSWTWCGEMPETLEGADAKAFLAKWRELAGIAR